MILVLWAEILKSFSTDSVLKVLLYLFERNKTERIELWEWTRSSCNWVLAVWGWLHIRRRVQTTTQGHTSLNVGQHSPTEWQRTQQITLPVPNPLFLKKKKKLSSEVYNRAAHWCTVSVRLSGFTSQMQTQGPFQAEQLPRHMRALSVPPRPQDLFTLWWGAASKRRWCVLRES